MTPDHINQRVAAGLPGYLGLRITQVAPREVRSELHAEGAVPGGLRRRRGRRDGGTLPAALRPPPRSVLGGDQGGDRGGTIDVRHARATLAYAAHPVAAFIEEPPVPKPNYAFEKRQRELEKKRKKEDKAQRKNRGDAPDSGAAPNEATAPAPPPAER